MGLFETMQSLKPMGLMSVMGDFKPMGVMQQMSGGSDASSPVPSPAAPVAPTIAGGGLYDLVRRKKTASAPSSILGIGY